MSKYSPVELFIGFKYYQGYRSPNTAEKEEKGYSSAWMHHKGRNKHHYEYWWDFGKDGLFATEMPKKYALEMFCDRVAASMIYQGEKYTDSHPLYYYKRTREFALIHPNTDAFMLELFEYMDQFGLDETIKYINAKRKE